MSPLLILAASCIVTLLTGSGSGVAASSSTSFSKSSISASSSSSYEFFRYAAYPQYKILKGNVTAVYDLLERVIPGSSNHFALSIVSSCPSVPVGQACYSMTDGSNGQINIVGTTAAELTAGVGVYLREFCNMTIGWVRGGGNNLFYPAVWPKIGSTPVTSSRIVPFSYIENVCTHSYTLVWYGWNDWQNYIDWMALSGINLHLGMTGQEYVQYKVFQSFGLDDLTIRTWFNGPQGLTWSRGQNEYGNNICGPLPLSWIINQWNLQLLILQRTRSLGIMNELPGFQGNVPWAISAIQGDTNITQLGDTGFMCSTDPLFAKIADKWMEIMCADFGCVESLYQMDSYFSGSVAPWISQGLGAPGSPGYKAAAEYRQQQHLLDGVSSAVLMPDSPVPSEITDNLPTCAWSTLQSGMYLAGCDVTNCASYPTVAEAEAACITDITCGGITSQANGNGPWELRQGNQPLASPTGENTYYITNNNACRPPPPPIMPDPVWLERGTAGYQGLNRTDPDAVWFYQGWALIDWSSNVQGSYFRGFVDAVPPGKFIVTDMSVDGTGEWMKWNNASFFGAPFIWTTLHDFGGTDGMKGNLAEINNIPFTGLPPNVNTTVLGTGYTPEGLLQNPVYYEFMGEANFRTAPVSDITNHIVIRSHRRYGLTTVKPEIVSAWSLLVNSTYAQDLSVQDSTGVPHFPGSSSQFEGDRRTPTPRLCLTWQVWGQMLQASTYINANTNPPFRYDLVNVGREMLAQLATPVSMNYSDAIHAKTLDAQLIQQTGQLYVDLLTDVDALVATDPGFLLGSWLEMARAWGANSSDCNATVIGAVDCPDYYEWTARVQLTSWNPVTKGAQSLPGGPLDYASKHWSGLINGYYTARASGILQLALANANNNQPLNSTAVDLFQATLAYNFQTSYPNTYPVTPVGDPVTISQAMYNKYSSYYAACGN